MKLEERLTVKLLAQAQAALGRAMNDALCSEPDRALVRALVREARALIDEFSDAYEGIAPAVSPQGATGPGSTAAVD